VADQCGALLIFDEVITGFRMAPTSYGVVCGVRPDLTCLGKIVGGGMPIGAVGGRRDVMSKLAPLGPVYQAGTLSGNPVAVAAGLATLTLLERENPYPEMRRLCGVLADGLNQMAKAAGVPLNGARFGSLFTPYFQTGTVTNLADAKRSDTGAHAKFFHGMLDRGIYLPPSQFEVGFISAAHGEADIAAFLAAARESLN
jgi:glutamate-1-semialdehyde 2,1-aminomutase